MKTTAFLIRVAICFLLSLIPVTELENRIFSVRMENRWNMKNKDKIVLIEADPQEINQAEFMATLQSRLLKLRPLLVQVNKNPDTNYFIVDSDGVIRKAQLKPKGRSSLPYAIYNQLHLPPESLHRLQEPHLINYLGPAGTFPRCTVSEFFLQKCPSIQGKIVLITENDDDYPHFQTPLGEMDASEVLANEIQMIVDRQFIFAAPLWARLIITLSMVLVGAFYIIYYPVLISSIATSGTGIVLVGLVFQLIFQYLNVYIPSANIVISILFTYLVFTGYRLAFQENLQWRSLKQAQYLRELDRMKTNFLSLVSHDLKTPIAKIQAVVERMRREINLPAQERSDWKELLDSIENSNNEMKNYITSILNLSKLESQKVIVNKKSNDINQLIQQALKRLKHFAQQKNIEIIQSLDPLFSIECDEDLMRQVVTNLIDNAIKFSPPNSKIIVRSKEEEGFVRFEVEDFGPGIPKDQLPLMFRKFSRILRPTQEQIKGTGLGLYLSKYFIELHGGTIRVKSIEGEGTTFSFTLPLNGVESESILG